jgi:hypothetical protein
MTAYVCERCHWRFLEREGQNVARCPHCYQVKLTVLDTPEEAHGASFPPERTIPFALSGEGLNRAITAFTSAIPFAPDDMTPARLLERAERIYLPSWLVDVEVEATWQGEAGFNYDVMSHEGRYAEGEGWLSREVVETRTRWEPRIGRLRRDYHDIPAPALEEADKLAAAIGGYPVGEARAYKPEDLKDVHVRVPDRRPDDAWPGAIPSLLNAAGDECRQAMGADHVRDFRWSPTYGRRNWTLLLRPLYSTYFLDDEGHPSPLLVHGITGRISGQRRASMKRAKRTSLIVLLVAAVILTVSLAVTAAGSLVPILLPIGGIGLLLGVVTGLGAAYPVLRAWSFNRSQIGRGG